MGNRGGLGQKGTDKLRQLVMPTSPDSSAESAALSTDTSKKDPGVRKGYVMPSELAERLREYVYSSRRTEISIVVEALESFLKRAGQPPVK